MARKTNRVKFEVFGKEMHAEEQYYLGDHTLPTAQSRFEWSEEMVEAYERCQKDIAYFAENFFVIVSQGKRIKIPLRDYQRKFLDDTMKHKRILALQSRQSGKCLSFDTKVKVRLKWFPISIKLKVGTLFKIQKIIFKTKCFLSSLFQSEEEDFRKNPEKTISKCLKFIKEK